ncbi:hypothetical protein BG015_005626 [Linnemannia schmuckeri]|uniref:Sel1 repeat family protein n=1 Tax=Linnemannia schmuckeri TaxID=64567 RepID=A0A9P5R5G6_9FUNG|nr:hypothetical protein BG015_005626 [Linnemannia schmuckeri]
MYFHDQSVVQDYVKAMEWCTKTADQHYAELELHIGMTYLEGDGVLVENFVALERINRSVEHRDGSGWSDYAQGCLYFPGLGDVPQDSMMTYECLVKVAEQVHTAVQIEFGNMYHLGIGVPRTIPRLWCGFSNLRLKVDYSEAFKGISKAAQYECLPSMTDMGIMFCYGDYDQARVWFLKAARGGRMKARRELGFMYHEGLGGPIDYQSAFEWFLKAAERGQAHAQADNGKHGTHKSRIKAMEWLRKSAEQEYADAQFELGNVFMNHRGFAMDIDTAMDWFDCESFPHHSGISITLELLPKMTKIARIANDSPVSAAAPTT